MLSYDFHVFHSHSTPLTAQDRAHAPMWWDDGAFHADAKGVVRWLKEILKCRAPAYCAEILQSNHKHLRSFSCPASIFPMARPCQIIYYTCIIYIYKAHLLENKSMKYRERERDIYIYMCRRACKCILQIMRLTHPLIYASYLLTSNARRLPTKWYTCVRLHVSHLWFS